MRSSFVQVHSFDHPNEFLVLRLRMDELGIRYFLENEILIQTDYLLSNAVGGVPLKVHPEDVDKAKELLVESGMLLPPEKRNNTPTLFDMIALNVKHKSSRWPTIIVLIIIVASIMGLLSWLLLNFNG